LLVLATQPPASSLQTTLKKAADSIPESAAFFIAAAVKAKSFPGTGTLILL
jgi:hypothetical protein